MPTPTRLLPLLEQFDFTCTRLIKRLKGPDVNTGDDSPVAVLPMTDEEYLWEPVPNCWSVRLKSAGPGARATVLVGGGAWGRDGGPYPRPYPPPFTTIAWRLSHTSEMLTLRADHMSGTHTLTQDQVETPGNAAGGIAAFEHGAAAWRNAVSKATEADLDAIGQSTFPYGSDPEVPFIETAFWVNQEVLHHGAEIALLRDLYREQVRTAT